MAVSSIKKKEKEPDKVRQKIAALHQNIGLVIKGKPEAISLAIITLLARGHLLIEDAPGVGKTLLAQSLAMSIHSSFQRIQFTSDLLPSDILGVPVYNPHTGAFEFKPGPSSPTSAWWTRSTAPPPRPRAPCSRR